jgi:hemoglobin-like flavoprotein
MRTKLRETKVGRFVSDIFDEAWDSIELRLEKRAFPLLKADIGREIQKTWDDATEKMSMDKLGKILFMNFFEVQPEAMALFKTDVGKHGAMLAGLMSASVQSLESLKALITSSIALGHRHSKYGAKPEYFQNFIKAVLRTFKDILKEDFKEKSEKAWTIMFTIMSTVMICGIQHSIEDEDTDSNQGSSSSSKHIPTSSGNFSEMDEIDLPRSTKTSPSGRTVGKGSTGGVGNVGSVGRSFLVRASKRSDHTGCTIT